MIIDDGTMRDRFVICHNPEEAKRDQQVREQTIRSPTPTGSPPAAARQSSTRGRLQARAQERFLRQTKTGKLRIDRATVNVEAHLDGKFLLRTSDPTLTAEDVALGYKQLLEIERAWRDMKTTLDLRPVHHRKEDRIRAHVLLCWLALLLIRIAENQTADTWRNLRDELQRMHLGRFRSPAGEPPNAPSSPPTNASCSRSSASPNHHASGTSRPPKPSNRRHTPHKRTNPRKPAPHAGFPPQDVPTNFGSRDPAAGIDDRR